MIDATGLNDYIESAKVLLGGEAWVKDADAVIIGYETLGGIVKRHIIICFLNDVPVANCINTIHNKLPRK